MAGPSNNLYYQALKKVRRLFQDLGLVFFQVLIEFSTSLILWPDQFIRGGYLIQLALSVKILQNFKLIRQSSCF